jgi:hypothetical protein
MVGEEKAGEGEGVGVRARTKRIWDRTWEGVGGGGEDVWRRGWRPGAAPERIVFGC